MSTNHQHATPLPDALALAGDARPVRALRSVPVEPAPVGTPYAPPSAAPSRVDAAMVGLRTAVPLTMSLLSLDERVEIDVACFLFGARRPKPMREWAADFLHSLLDDEDDLVRNVARFELVALGHPAPEIALWAWDRDPLAVVVDLLCGDDPRRIPESTHPIIVDIEADGRLTFTGRIV